MHFFDPVAQRIGNHLQDVWRSGIERVAAARHVVVVAAVVVGAVVAGVVEATKSERGSSQARFTRVVVDHVENDFEPSAV